MNKSEEHSMKVEVILQNFELKGVEMLCKYDGKRQKDDESI